MSVAETVRRIQDAEAEADAILAATDREAKERIARARQEASRLIVEAAAAARGRIEQLRMLSQEEEAAGIAAIEEAVRVEREEIRARASRNRATAAAVLGGLVARLAGEQG